ncbi:MAG: hypothetical protein ACXVPD_08945, partial [Bacteroidia bacterium]
MKKILLMFSLCFAFCLTSFSQQVQPQGDYHKMILKKLEAERKKNKSKEALGIGVIMFSDQEIPRLGKVKETEDLLKVSFKANQQFVGRVYLPRAVGKMDPKLPEALIYRFYIDTSSVASVVEVGREAMPESAWSSWILDFPRNFENGMASVPAGKHKIRIEIWSSREELTEKVEDSSKNKLWATGEFLLT